MKLTTEELADVLYKNDKKIRGFLLTCCENQEDVNDMMIDHASFYLVRFISMIKECPYDQTKYYLLTIAEEKFMELLEKEQNE